MYALEEGQQSFSVRGQSTYFSFGGPYGLCHNHTVLSLQSESSNKTIHIKEWVLLCSNKTLVATIGCELDLSLDCSCQAML